MASINDERGMTISRRRGLKMLGAAGVFAAVGPALSACGRDEPENSTPEGSGDPDSGGNLSGSVSIAIPLATDQDQSFYTAQFKTFTEQTGVEVNFLHFPNAQYGESIQGLFRGGDAPDVYRMATPPALMLPSYGNDWLQPLDEFAAVTELLQQQYGETALDPAASGLHVGGELYGVPGVSNTVWNNLRPLMVNPQILEQYGISEPPQTWSELRDTAAKIATDSGGDTYGYALLGGNNLLRSNNLIPLWSTAGPVREPAPNVTLDYLTGRAGASHPSVVEAVALTRGMVEDGSIVPGWQNMDAPAFWQAWAAGQIAMAPISPWWGPEIAKVNADAGMDFVAVPGPDSGMAGCQIVESEWVPTWGMTADAANPEAAAALIAFLGSLDVQHQYYGESRVPSALAEEYSDDLGDIAKSIFAVDPGLRRGPDPIVRSHDALAVIQAIQQSLPSPGFDQILFSAVDEGADYEELAGTFDAALNDIIDAELDAAGLDAEIFAFPDWDPMTDYTTT